MIQFQTGLQDFWFYVLTPVLAIGLAFAYKKNSAGAMIWIVVGWLLSGALVHLDAAQGAGIAKAAGRLLGHLLAQFGIV